MTKEEIKTAAMQLDPVEREALAEELLLTLPQLEEEAIDAASLEEARRRYESFLQSGGVAKTVDEVVARLRSSVRR
jgi:hypothetical protein